jgi:oligoendopeptidase F
VSKVDNSTISLSHDECYKIAYQFAHEYDNEYYELLKNMHDDNRLNIIDFKKCKFYFVSFFQWIPYLKKSYVFINDFGSLNTIKAILHEVQHAFECELTAYRFPHKNDSYFSEVTPLFIELVFVDYLKNKGLFKKEIAELEKSNIFTLKNYAIEIKKSLLIENFIDNYCKSNNYDEKQRATLYFDNIKIQNALEVIGIRNISISDIETGKRCFVPMNLCYITNQLIAYKLFDIYLKDKEEALRAIRYLIINNDKDPIDNYNALGIDINYDSLLSLYDKYVDKVMNKEDVEDEQLLSSSMNY